MYENFSLGGFSFQGDSPLLITGSLDGLVRDIKEAIDPEESKRRDTPMARLSDNAKVKKKPGEKKRVLTRSNLSLAGGLHTPEYLAPIPISQNTNQHATFSGSEEGYTYGLMYQKVIGKKDGFGWFVGLHYHQMSFNNEYSNIGMTYDKSAVGDPLVDREGNIYDLRFVDVPNFNDAGRLDYITPEFGLLFNFKLGRWAYFQAQGSLSHYTLVQKTSNTTGTVTYRGQIEGQGAPISQDALGFYTNQPVDWSRPFTEMQSFMAYQLGSSFDIMLGQHLSLFVGARYNHSLTYAIREKVNTDLPFFDIDEASWKSPLNYLTDSRHFKSISLNFGLRIYLHEMR